MLTTLLGLALMLPARSPAEKLADYLTGFTYQERKDMKIDSLELVELLKEGKAQLNELPSRLNELVKNKLIVTACPQYDRSNMARLYLITKGYKARYLNDGLLGLAELLRGSQAREFANVSAQ